MQERRKLLSAMLVTCTLALLALPSLPVFATSAVNATGTITVVSFTPTGAKTAGRYTILTGTFIHSYAGNFVGTDVAPVTIIVHPSGAFDFYLLSMFTGAVNGKSGTMTILFVGKAEGFGMAAKGLWIILSGTGDLANLHGQGRFEGIAGAGGTYTGRIHFGPN